MSAPQIISIEIGDEDAMTVVITFDQDIVASDIEPDPDDVAMSIADPTRGGYAVPNPGWAGRGRQASARR